MSSVCPVSGDSQSEKQETVCCGAAAAAKWQLLEMSAIYGMEAALGSIGGREGNKEREGREVGEEEGDEGSHD